MPVTYYIGTGLQLFGMIAVGICLLSGLDKGDYGKMELVQFLGGAAFFYLGAFVRKLRK